MDDSLIGGFDDSGRDRAQGREIRGRMREDGRQGTEVGGQVSGFRKDEPRRADFSETAERMYRGAQELIKSGRKRDGVDELEKLVGFFPDYALAHNDLGALYFDEGDKEKALQHYQKAAALESHNPIFQKTLADFYYVVLGQVEDALEHYTRTLSCDSSNIGALLMLGHISVSMRKFEEAKIFYNNVLEIEPWNKDAREKLGQMGEMD